jgi:pimeloyl-ACP methyl ester carboxylesterase
MEDDTQLAGARPDAKPTLLLVHGAWHGSWAWELVAPGLESAGWQVRTVDLPSTAERGGPRHDLYDDAAVVRATIQEIDGPVVVVAHSYGGAVVSEGAGLPNVRHIVYVAGFQLDVGEALLRQGVDVPAWWVIDDDLLTPADPRHVLYADLRSDLADRVIARLRPLSLAACSQPLTVAAWRTVPSTYVLCENDQAFPDGVQEFFAARAKNVRRLPSSHSPFFSLPSELTELIVEAAANA